MLSYAKLLAVTVGAGAHQETLPGHEGVDTAEHGLTV